MTSALRTADSLAFEPHLAKVRHDGHRMLVVHLPRLVAAELQVLADHAYGGGSLAGILPGTGLVRMGRAVPGAALFEINPRRFGYMVATDLDAGDRLVQTFNPLTCAGSVCHFDPGPAFGPFRPDQPLAKMPLGPPDSLANQIAERLAALALPAPAGVKVGNQITASLLEAGFPTRQGAHHSWVDLGFVLLEQVTNLVQDRIVIYDAGQEVILNEHFADGLDRSSRPVYHALREAGASEAQAAASARLVTA